MLWRLCRDADHKFQVEHTTRIIRLLRLIIRWGERPAGIILGAFGGDVISSAGHASRFSKSSQSSEGRKHSIQFEMATVRDGQPGFREMSCSTY